MRKKLLVLVGMVFVGTSLSSNCTPAKESTSSFVKRLVNGAVYQERFLRRWGFVGGTSVSAAAALTALAKMGSGRTKIATVSLISLLTLVLGCFSFAEFARGEGILDPSKVGEDLHKCMGALLLDIGAFGKVVASGTINDLMRGLSDVNSVLDRFGGLVFILQCLVAFERTFVGGGFNFKDEHLASFVEVEAKLASLVQAYSSVIVAKLSDLTAVVDRGELSVRINSVHSGVSVDLAAVGRAFGGKYPLCSADQAFGELQNLLNSVRSRGIEIYSIFSAVCDGTIYGEKDKTLTNLASVGYLGSAMELLVKLHKALTETVEFGQEAKELYEENVLREELSILDAKKQRALAEAKEKNAEAVRREAEAEKLGAEKRASDINSGLRIMGGVADLLNNRPVGTQGIHLDHHHRDSRGR